MDEGLLEVFLWRTVDETDFQRVFGLGFIFVLYSCNCAIVDGSDLSLS